ncbi:hypothetical protein B0H15DRAFT_799149 [Mycena belliarum]|uniref:Uncharacterized protein n=1 Tax=Mycena belliarum TaxID=1033014 RepID=A0AAD6XR49_9AGAR|nr:hypothetical protein B0H15DRAFT_799149 [Mycena belliae]
MTPTPTAAAPAQLPLLARTDGTDATSFGSSDLSSVSSLWSITVCRRARLTESWEIMKATIPGFGDDMIALAGDLKLRKQIQKGLNAARGDDAGSLKIGISAMLLPPPHAPVAGQPAIPAVTISPPIPDRGSKALRGFNHSVTASAMCPHKYPDTPATYEAIRDGDPNFPVLGTQFPRFMYASGQAVKHVYQGPSAALAGPGAHKGKAGNASINGLTELTKRAIAYVAMQVRFAMSSLAPDLGWCIHQAL